LSFCSSPALYAKHERREECERVDDTPLINAAGEGRGDEGNEQISHAKNECDIIRARVRANRRPKAEQRKLKV
jgi:hypothetical protein